MDPQGPATSRIRLLLVTVAEIAGATCAALFAPRASGLALVVQFEVNQTAFDIAYGGWARKRDELEAGRCVRYGKAVLWPLFEGRELVAVVYLDRAPQDFPDDLSREDGAVIATRMRRLSIPSPFTSLSTTKLSARDALREMQRDQLATTLSELNGNVSAAARHLGIARETFYARAHRLDIEIAEFRKRRSGRSSRRRLSPA